MISWNGCRTLRWFPEMDGCHQKIDSGSRWIQGTPETSGWRAVRLTVEFPILLEFSTRTHFCASRRKQRIKFNMVANAISEISSDHLSNMTVVKLKGSAISRFMCLFLAKSNIIGRLGNLVMIWVGQRDQPRSVSSLDRQWSTICSIVQTVTNNMEW